MCERKCYQSPIKFVQNTPTLAHVSEKDKCWKWFSSYKKSPHNKTANITQIL